MTTMTKSEFDAIVDRAKLPLNEATRTELYGVMDKIEALVARVTRDKPREVEPALIFVPEQQA